MTQRPGLGRRPGATGGPASARPGQPVRRPPSAFTRPAAHSAGFAPADWALLTAVAAMWGSAFLFIDLGVEHLRPELVGLLRLAVSAAILAAIPAARRGVPRSAWPAIALLGTVWMAVPFVLFPLAQQWIDSSLAGMLGAAAPLFTALVATLVARQLPGGRQRAGLLLGFLGVLAISWPSLGGAHATALGAALVLLATLLFGIAFNLAAPLQQRHGALAVLWRAQLVALLLLAPAGLASVPASSFAWSSLLAVAALGSLGTALGYAAFTMLVGRVGSTRASVSVYFLPVVAIALGALFRDEAITGASVLGTGLVAVGAYLTSRKDRRTPSPTRQRSPKAPCGSTGHHARHGLDRQRVSEPVRMSSKDERPCQSESPGDGGLRRSTGYVLRRRPRCCGSLGPTVCRRFVE